jgi:TonB family protein
MYSLPVPHHYGLCTLLFLALCAGARADGPRIITDIPAAAVATTPGLPETAANPGTAAGGAMDAAAENESISRYLDSISELQRNHGAFDEQIGEQLTGIGLVYRNLGRHPEALTALNRALHINRVNHGLHSLDQIPILEQIIATNDALSDWSALDQNYHFLYWIYRRNYGADNPRLLPVLDRIGFWHLNTFSRSQFPDAFGHLLSAVTMFQNAIAIIEASYGPYDQRQLNPLLGIILVNFQLKTALQSSYMGLTDPDFFDANSRMYDERNVRDFLIADAYRRGKSALEKVMDIYEKNPEFKPVNHGMALIQMGDWNLLFDRRSTANKFYTMAYAKLAAGGLSAGEINRIFEQPRSLPALPVPLQEQNESETPANEASYVLAKFDVTKSGRTKNIEIVESMPVDNELLQQRALDTIRETRFRPRLEDGQPVDANDINIRYVFHD